MTFGLLIQLGTNMWERPGEVADLVKDTVETFDHPRLSHLGLEISSLG